SHNGVGGGDRPSQEARYQQPASGSQEGRQHAVDQQFRRSGHGHRVDAAAADGGGNLAACQIRPQKFKYHGDHNRLPHGYGAGAHGGAHGRGDIRGSETPSHEHAKDTGENKQDVAVFSNHGHDVYSSKMKIGSYRASNSCKRPPTSWARLERSPIQSITL